MKKYYEVLQKLKKQENVIQEFRKYEEVCKKMRKWAKRWKSVPIAHIFKNERKTNMTGFGLFSSKAENLIL